jgi:hypothetical protein
VIDLIPVDDPEGSALLAPKKIFCNGKPLDQKKLLINIANAGLFRLSDVTKMSFTPSMMTRPRTYHGYTPLSTLYQSGFSGSVFPDTAWISRFSSG